MKKILLAIHFSAFGLLVYNAILYLKGKEIQPVLLLLAMILVAIAYFFKRQYERN